VGLDAKNAILIVEFAREREDHGDSTGPGLAPAAALARSADLARLTWASPPLVFPGAGIRKCAGPREVAVFAAWWA